MKLHKINHPNLIDKYLISRKGDVFSLKTNKFLSHCTDGRYIVVRAAESNHYLHRLLALTFKNNPKNLPQVNHKNGNKKDFRLSNLEWCTSKHNVIHAHKNGLARHTPTRPNIRAAQTKTQYKKVENTLTGQKFESLIEAAKVTKIKYTTLAYWAQKNMHGYRYSEQQSQYIKRRSLSGY